ncbi:MAG: ZIP family metal transporter [Pyrinomonadaceae bacterium]|nr:ZIP family metal transporter [Pyrinomonadaceae bacterium]
MNVWLYSLGSVFSLSLISLLGVIALSKSGFRYLNNLLTYLISLAAGILLGGATFHLLPEAAEAMGTGTRFSLTLASSFIAFFLLEKFLIIHHHGVIESDLTHNHNNFDDNSYDDGDELETSNHTVRPLVWLNLVGGAIHNFVDGATIAVSFMLNPTIGLTTVVATVLHEVPREIGDFAVLTHGGLSVKRALLFNFLTSIFSVLGALAVLLLGTRLKGYTDFMLPVAAANFLYISLTNLLPELSHVRNRLQSLQQIVFLVTGVALMYFLKQVTE